MSLLVKLCGMRTEADLAAAVAAGADAVGFVLTPSPRRVEVAEAGVLARSLPDYVRVVAVFHQPEPDLVVETGRVLDPDLYQAEPRYLARVDPAQVLPVLVDGPGLDRRIHLALSRYPSGMVLVDSAARGGTGGQADWRRVAALRNRSRVIMAGGLNPDNVAEAVRKVRPGGVDVSSGIETSPGVKDPESMTRFVAAARAALERGEAVR